MKLYVVTSEYPGGSEFLMTIFENRKSAIAAYDKINKEVSLDVYEIQSQHDEKDYKEIFYYDGTYGLTITFKSVETNKEIDLFSR